MLKLTEFQLSQPMFSWWGDRENLVKFDDVAGNVGPGWRPLLEDLCVKLFRLGWDGDLSQVKEKFGSLRFYWNCNVADETTAAIMFDVVEQAEAQSSLYCEECGRSGETRGPGWLLTLCRKHAFDRKKTLRAWELDDLVRTGEITQEQADIYNLQDLDEDSGLG